MVMWIISASSPCSTVDSHSNREKPGPYHLPYIWCLNSRIHAELYQKCEAITPWETTLSIRVLCTVEGVWVCSIKLLLPYRLHSFLVPEVSNFHLRLPSVRLFHSFAIQYDSPVTDCHPSRDPWTPKWCVQRWAIKVSFMLDKALWVLAAARCQVPANMEVGWMDLIF